MNPKQQPPASEIAIRYDKAEIVYVTEFLVSPGMEELMLDFSSGLIADARNEQGKSLPIHTRLALPWSAVERLTQILNQVVEKRKHLVEQNRQPTEANSPTQTIPQASLPWMRREQIS